MDENRPVEEAPPSDETPLGDADRDAGPAPGDPFAALDELLRRPQAIFGRRRHDGGLSLPYLAAGALICCALYGAASGVFQGGGQILVTAFKSPLIVLISLALCTPSLYVFSSLAGVEVSPRWLAATLVGLAGMLGLLLVALMPISWLFSVSSRSLAFLAVLHLVVWIVAVHFGFKFLTTAFRQRRTEAAEYGRDESRPSMAWMLLFVLVSLQVASQMRPLLWRDEGQALFAPRKMLFLEHFSRIAVGEEAVAVDDE